MRTMTLWYWDYNAQAFPWTLLHASVKKKNTLLSLPYDLPPSNTTEHTQTGMCNKNSFRFLFCTLSSHINITIFLSFPNCYEQTYSLCMLFIVLGRPKDEHQEAQQQLKRLKTHTFKGFLDILPNVISIMSAPFSSNNQNILLESHPTSTCTFVCWYLQHNVVVHTHIWV